MSDWPVNSRPDDIPLDVPVDVLTSYHYFKDVDIAAMRDWGLRIIGDSGAFSAMTSGNPIDREQFHQWATRWRDALLWTAALDVIGDPEATRANWHAAQVDGLNLVPTLHYLATTKDLDYYAEQGVDLIGLGGMVPYGSEPERLMRWCLMMHRHARDHHPHVRFHGWGISTPLLMDNLPWWSADSSGFAAAFRFARLRLFDPDKGRHLGVDLNGRDIAKHHRLLAKHYGITDWHSIAVSTPVTRRALGRVAIRAVQVYARWLQARQRVTPPASLIPKLAYWENVSEGPQFVGGILTNNEGCWALNPAGEQQMRGTAGPLHAAVIQASNDAGRALNPAGDVSIRGPLAVAAHGNSVSTQTQTYHPDDSVVPPRGGGPSAYVALGSPSMQPVKALSPGDREPPLGPSLVIANTTAEFINPVGQGKD